jgi:hypothetical protein
MLKRETCPDSRMLSFAQLQRLAERMEREVALERAQKNQDPRPQTGDRRPA